ncbi:Glycosyl Hydrolase Family 88 [Mariniphaga anaerophila]|uniref:Glycosyl Hydrolase Family 88 n=1 Tax=Mariniphaga anaerophila TaxID=1484053 RepID=A0A1M5AT86_9BACT|nr:glycoside hydrolase family 88 protein [Mariniphaga anaerophila]SHF33307.1 Glycosyl Hydrolase Family 88 [Mariniphaga anaerophila]
MKLHNLLFVLIALFATSCAGEKGKKAEFPQIKQELSDQLKVLVKAIPDDKVPRSYPDKDGGYWWATIKDWTCGFPAGSFWYMYEMTGDEYWKGVALDNTLKLDGVQFRTTTHDLGFMVFCSYGNAYRLTGNEAYKDVIIQGSESLLTRFNPTIGCIRSWDHGKWEFPVIVDNMMNLEMLFWASKVTGDPKYKDVAVSHADVTLKNHFRDDWSSYHVVSYDTITGQPVEKHTHQGLNHESAWGRGQAWGFYGYTMCYRETGDEKYLEAAENIGAFILKNLPEDKVSYWDYNDPAIPNAYRDASAAAIIASALFELSQYSSKGEMYLDVANKIVETLSSKEYRANDGSNGGFILKHSVGHKPKESEVDVAINYADYYYLESLKRQQELIK